MATEIASVSRQERVLKAVTNWRAHTCPSRAATVQLVPCRKADHISPELLLFQEKLKKNFFVKFYNC